MKQSRTKLGISEDDMPYSAAIIRNKDSVESILGLAGRLYLHGNSVAFEKINELSMNKGSLTKYNYKVLYDLSTYRWIYEDSPLWNECHASSEFRLRSHHRHELLGSGVPAGNGLEMSWRNILQVEDVSWLQGHQLEETVVFPGAGYVAMAIEALLQATGGFSPDKPKVVVQNFNILSVLALSKESTAQVELSSTLRPTPITYASNSNEWWEFTTISFSNSVSTTHATGTLRTNSQSRYMSLKYQMPSSELEPTATRVV